MTPPKLEHIDKEKGLENVKSSSNYSGRKTFYHSFAVIFIRPPIKWADNGL